MWAEGTADKRARGRAEGREGGRGAGREAGVPGGQEGRREGREGCCHGTTGTALLLQESDDDSQVNFDVEVIAPAAARRHVHHEHLEYLNRPPSRRGVHSIGLPWVAQRRG